MMLNTDVYESLQTVMTIAKAIKGDTGGGCPLAKSALMAFLAHRLQLKTYVEIGVYRGRGLLPVAAAIKKNNGFSIGIDPYSNECLAESEIPDHLKDIVNDFIQKIDLNQIYYDVIRYIDEFGLFDSVNLIRTTSQEAVPLIKAQFNSIDLLHIDGNHDFELICKDIEQYIPLVSHGGIIVLDDIDWPGVKRSYENLLASANYRVLIETEYFAVLQKKDSLLPPSRYNHLVTECRALYERIDYYDKQNIIKENLGISAVIKPVVAVGITAYKHEKYIEKCLTSVLSQQGSFQLRVVIAEDSSGDNTASIIKKVLRENENTDAEIIFIENTQNLGLIPNLLQVFQSLGTCDYFTFCEGDDYWTDKNKIQKHINFLNEHQNCSMTFNRLMLYWEKKKKFEEYKPQLELKKDMISAYELADFNIIGTLSCSFYTGQYLKDIDYSIFTENLSDWIFNLYFSYTFGDIGMVDEPLTVYRKHNQSSWTGMEETKKWITLSRILDYYNGYFDYEFDEKFQNMKNKLALEFQFAKKEPMFRYDLLMIDDVFPHPASGFRLEELSAYLRQIPSSYLLNWGPEEGMLGGKTTDIIRKFRRSNKDLGNKISRLDKSVSIGAQLAYCVFISNAFFNIDFLEQNKIPFVVELYPGGLLMLDDPESDQRLARIFNSPYFVKVITTQKRTYDYLINKHFCVPEKILHIFGVVTPASSFKTDSNNIRHYGLDKNTLDICFVAFKYTQFGEDKGYDLFIEVAKELCKKHDSIFFHVVGNFDETILDVSEIKHRIKFYGKMTSAELQEFYNDKDIILSPNISGKIFKGAFDGFPTGSCTEGALRETAIFCTDEFGSNDNLFKEGEEIVIIPYNAPQIADIIQAYFENPEKLRKIGENGAKGVKELYGYDVQLLPRLQLLKNEIEISKNGERKIVLPPSPSKKVLIINRLSKIKFLRECVKVAKKILPKRVKEVLKKIYKRICGEYA